MTWALPSSQMPRFGDGLLWRNSRNQKTAWELRQASNSQSEGRRVNLLRSHFSLLHLKGTAGRRRVSFMPPYNNVCYTCLLTTLIAFPACQLQPLRMVVLSSGTVAKVIIDRLGIGFFQICQYIINKSNRSLSHLLCEKYSARYFTKVPRWIWHNSRFQVTL